MESELRAELEAQRLRNAELEEQVQQLRTRAVELAVQNEQEEEFITNKLMKSLNEAREEKTKMLMELEQEQEFLTNNLQRKLDLVMAEKSELENRLRKEEEYILLTKSLIENAQATKIELDDKLIQEGNQAIEGLKECLEVLLEEKKDHTLRDKLMRFLDFIKKEHDRLIESQTDYTEKHKMLLAKVKELESENIAFSEQIHKQSAVLKQLRKDTQSTM